MRIFTFTGYYIYQYKLLYKVVLINITYISVTGDSYWCSRAGLETNNLVEIREFASLVITLFFINMTADLTRFFPNFCAECPVNGVFPFLFSGLSEELVIPCIHFIAWMLTSTMSYYYKQLQKWLNQC